MAEGAPRGIERLELKIARLQVTFRFTFAFHAREVRFERDAGQGFERVFPETFSFHADRHDPGELILYLDALLRKPRLIDARANRRDSLELVMRIVSQVPRYLERIVEQLEEQQRLSDEGRARMHQDVAILSQLLLRFVQTRDLVERRSARVASWMLLRRVYRSLFELVRLRVAPEYIERYCRGEIDPVDPSDDPSESGVFHALESGSQEVVHRILMRMTERSFYQWLEGVCLDPDNQAFEKEDSPFADREREVLATTLEDGGDRLTRAADLVPFLRRPGRDTQRVLKKLETWFLRRYDIPNSSAIIQHAAWLVEDGGALRDPQRVLSWHGSRNYALLLGALAAPFLAATVAYQRAPLVFDTLCSAEVLLVNASALWFLVYSFLVRRDLTLFHASVPRILAGVIVGYLPVFLIDEVWDLVEHSVLMLGGIGFLLGITTLLYIFVEVQRKLGDTRLAFERARGIFLLGVLEAFGVGVVMTNLVGGFMVARNWVPDEGPADVESLRFVLEPLVGQLPRIVGFEPLLVYPSAVFTMTFLSFFIGIFLQLMWEDLPITEPL